MKGPYFSLNGEILPVAQAVVPWDDLAFGYGFGVYETLKVRHGLVYFSELHEDRLWNSARILRLDHRWKSGDFVRFVHALVAANETVDANLKAFLVGGPDAEDARLVIVQLAPLFPNRSLYKHGATAITWSGERIFPQAKSLNMLVSYLAFREARRIDAYDALLVDRNDHLTEGTRTNLFVSDGTSLATALPSQVLDGVTQRTVRQVIHELDIPLMERPLPRDEIRQWKGAFLTSTSTKVLPLNRVDDVSIPLCPLIERVRVAYDKWLDAYAQSLA